MGEDIPLAAVLLGYHKRSNSEPLRGFVRAFAVVITLLRLTLGIACFHRGFCKPDFRGAVGNERMPQGVALPTSDEFPESGRFRQRAMRGGLGWVSHRADPAGRFFRQP